MLKRITVSLAQLLFPGSGFALLGSYKLAALNALFLMAYGWALCLASTWGPAYFITGISFAILSHIFCLVYVSRRTSTLSLRWGSFFIYLVMFSLIWNITLPTRRIQAFNHSVENSQRDFRWMKESFFVDMNPAQYIPGDTVLVHEKQSLNLRKLIELKETTAIIATVDPSSTKEINLDELKGRKLYVWFSKDLSRLFKFIP
jgi:hypothetical protein